MQSWNLASKFKTNLKKHSFVQSANSALIKALKIAEFEFCKGNTPIEVFTTWSKTDDWQHRVLDRRNDLHIFLKACSLEDSIGGHNIEQCKALCMALLQETTKKIFEQYVSSKHKTKSSNTDEGSTKSK